jgi:hypothetical protein
MARMARMARMATSEFTESVTAASTFVQLLSNTWTASSAGAWLISTLVQRGRNGPFTRDLIYAKSPFFAKAFGGTFQDGIDQSIHLREDAPPGFELVVYWLYRGQLPPILDEREIAPAHGHSKPTLHPDSWNSSSKPRSSSFRTKSRSKPLTI